MHLTALHTAWQNTHRAISKHWVHLAVTQQTIKVCTRKSMPTYLPALICFNQIQHTEALQWPRTSNPSGSPLGSRNGMTGGSRSVSQY